MTTPACPERQPGSDESYDVEGESVIATDDGLVLYGLDELPPS